MKNRFFIFSRGRIEIQYSYLGKRLPLFPHVKLEFSHLFIISDWNVVWGIGKIKNIITGRSY